MSAGASPSCSTTSTSPRRSSATPILGGSGLIEGNFTVESAQNLSVLLRAGALPADLTIVEERTVGPSLGQDSIRAGAIASVVALVAVVVFMIVCYGILGFFADVAMIVNTFLMFGIITATGATLTLPGIAGIVLTMGMAVDANVLIYERMREEAHNGRSTIAVVRGRLRTRACDDRRLAPDRADRRDRALRARLRPDPRLRRRLRHRHRLHALHRLSADAADRGDLGAADAPEDRAAIGSRQCRFASSPTTPKSRS